MARKRMFDLEVVDTDLFLEMPQSTQNLYFHLGMRADDDGFVSNPKKIIRTIGANEDDLKILFSKQFIIPFESGVVVIRHWKLNNFLRKDRHTNTIYLDEKKLLTEDENGVYNLNIEDGQLVVNQMTTAGQPSIEENSIEKYSIEESSIDNNIPASEVKTSIASAKANKHKYGDYQNVLLKDEELQKLKQEYENWEELIKYLDEYIEMKGYKAKSHYLCIKKWVIDAVKRNGHKKQNDIAGLQRSSKNKWEEFYANS